MSAQNICADRTATSDEQVMAAVKAGSVDAFEVLDDRSHQRAHQIARAVCRDHGRAEDAVQEASSSIWTYEAQVGKVAPCAPPSESARHTTDEPLHAVGMPGDVPPQVTAHV